MGLESILRKIALMNKTNYFIWKLLCFRHLARQCVYLHALFLSTFCGSFESRLFCNLEIPHIHLFSLQLENCFFHHVFFYESGSVIQSKQREKTDNLYFISVAIVFSHYRMMDCEFLLTAKDKRRMALNLVFIQSF